MPQKCHTCAWDNERADAWHISSPLLLYTIDGSLSLVSRDISINGFRSHRTCSGLDPNTPTLHVRLISLHSMISSIMEARKSRKTREGEIQSSRAGLLKENSRNQGPSIISESIRRPVPKQQPHCSAITQDLFRPPRWHQRRSNRTGLLNLRANTAPSSHV